MVPFTEREPDDAGSEEALGFPFLLALNEDKQAFSSSLNDSYAKQIFMISFKACLSQK